MNSVIEGFLLVTLQQLGGQILKGEKGFGKRTLAIKCKELIEKYEYNNKL